MKKTALVLLLASLAGCGEKAPPPPPPVKAPEPPKTVTPPKPGRPAMAPPLTDAQNAALHAAFNKARELVKQAQEFKKQGDAILKASGAAAANDTYLKASELYKKAIESTEEWVEPELEKVTEAQVRDYLEVYRNERGGWVKEKASMGKLHKD